MSNLSRSKFAFEKKLKIDFLSFVAFLLAAVVFVYEARVSSYITYYVIAIFFAALSLLAGLESIKFNDDEREIVKRLIDSGCTVPFEAEPLKNLGNNSLFGFKTENLKLYTEESGFRVNLYSNRFALYSFKDQAGNLFAVVKHGSGYYFYKES